jgi:uncharacterized peroxidase-related enzyme
LTDHLIHDYRRAPISEADKAMLGYVEKLTIAPSEMRESDVAALREHGFTDRAILDVVLMAGLFNLYNRVVDGLGGYTFEGMAEEAQARGIASWREGTDADSH